MDFKTKRSHRTKEKWLFGIGMILMLIFFISFIGVLIIMSWEAKNDVHVAHWIPVASACTMAFFALVGMMFIIQSGVHGRERNAYRKDILYYRQLRYFNIILTLITEKNFKQTIYWYNTFLKDDHLKDFLFPYYVHALLSSTKKKDRKKGQELLMEIRKIYNPETVFNKPCEKILEKMVETVIVMEALVKSGKK